MRRKEIGKHILRSASYRAAWHCSRPDDVAVEAINFGRGFRRHGVGYRVTEARSHVSDIETQRTGDKMQLS